MENCPFCGKAFKRLKSHLPHCKMADARGDPTATGPAKKNPKAGTKKASLGEAKEQQLTKEGGDNMERTRKPELTKKKHKHLEPSSYRTQKATFVEKEKEDLKEDPKNSPADQGWADPGSQGANIPKNILLAPGLDRPAPGLDRSAPGLDRPAPSLNRPAPGLDRLAPGLDRPAPGLDRPAPGLDRPAPSLDRPAPGLDRPAPGLDRPAPSLNRPAPGLDRPAPGLDRPTPGLDRPAPGLDRPAPGLDRPAPGLDRPSPGLDRPAPSLNRPAPGLDRLAPGLDRPAPGLDRPAPGLDRPAPSLNRPSPGLDRLAPGLDRLAPGLDRPVPGLDRPAPGLHRPARGLDRPAPGSDRPSPGSDRPSPGSDRPAPGSDRPAPGFHIHLSTSDLDQTHPNDHSDDKEGNRSGYYPIKVPTAVTTLPSLEAATSLVQMGPTHAAVTHSQTSALQALPGGSESLKASEDNLTWPSRKEDVRGALEKTGSDGVKSPLYEEVCKVLKGGRQGENLASFGSGLEGSFIEKHFQKPEDQPTELPSEPSSPYRLSAMTSSYRVHSQFPRYTDHAPLPDMSHPLQTGDPDSLKNQKKSLEGLLDLTTANKTQTFLPVGDVPSRNGSLGLQWIPELHSNYIQLRIVPEKMDLTRSDGRIGKSVAPGPADSECRQPTHRQLAPEVPLTSRRLMDVRIGELPSWLALQRLSMKSIPDLGLRAWTRYYNKYINVRKGGIGGLTMILAGYCALSYAWNYQHIRQDRWRRYH